MKISTWISMFSAFAVAGILLIAGVHSVSAREKQTTKLTPEEVKKQVDAAMAKKTPKVEIVTSQGNIRVELDAVKAPISSRNFLQYVVEGHYNSTVFHRVIRDFMIQGGGFTADMKEKTDSLRAAITNEARNGLSNKRGTLAMARTQVVDSARAQFFINVVDNQRLDYRGPGLQFGYAVFGKVISGMEVVDKIREIPTVNRGGAFAAWPTTTVVIRSMKIVD